ncbi:hypothetical protein BC835DRAFT_691214 [Cytidiella melzeri]|nr:hypothetical protein BC835DRAFT_691214 [Cytidiella melzeri]
MAAFPGHDSPHPLLTKPVLYLVDPPKRVKWYHLEKAFNSCGTITSGGKNPVLGQPNRKTRIVQFSSVFHAEMALATLQGTIVVNSGAPWKVVLSHSPTLQPALPPDCIFPQYVRTNSTGTPGPIGGEESPQTLFKWFRRAGPLVSVRKNVNMGYPQHAIVVEYWSERDASLAQSKTNALHEDMHHRPAFTLRTYDSRNLYCAASHTRTKTSVGLDSFGFISFLSIASAAAAVQTMNGKLIGNRSVIVRYFEPDALNIFRSQYSSIATHARCYGQSHPSSTQPVRTSSQGFWPHWLTLWM